MLREIKDYLLIKSSGYFDPKYYLLNNPDVRRADIDPLLHYLRNGWSEGRSPSKIFEPILAADPERYALTSNPLITFIKNERVERQKSRPSINKIFRFLYKGLIFFYNLKGIVFIGGYPYSERERDGYYQRIRSVDKLFTDRWRIYIDGVYLQGRDAWYDFPALNTLVLRVNESGKRKWLVGLCLGLSILRTGVLYSHSILPLGGVKSLMRLPGIKKIIDVHGVVPEEFQYQGDSVNARFYEQVERVALENANYIIVVSEAMRNHLEGKYHGNIQGRFITLPIIQRVPVVQFVKPYINSKPVIIYSGGVQKWQQVPRMIDAMSRTASYYEYRFYCPAPKEVLSMLPETLRIIPSVVIGSKSPEEIILACRECHYGFILREDILVNRVACPTKLMEYLATGVIPVVDSENIGDFKAMGMQYIHLTDLLKNQLPGEEARQLMAKTNFAVYEQLLDKYIAGVDALQQVLK
jgi:hypothetical protein